MYLVSAWNYWQLSKQWSHVRPLLWVKTFICSGHLISVLYINDYSRMNKVSGPEINFKCRFNLTEWYKFISSTHERLCALLDFRMRKQVISPREERISQPQSKPIQWRVIILPEISTAYLCHGQNSKQSKWVDLNIALWELLEK